MTRTQTHFRNSRTTSPVPSISPIDEALDMGKRNIGYGSLLVELVQLAAPSMITVAMVFLLSGITFAFTGHLIGTDAVGPVSISFFFISIVALYPGSGIAFAVDTLCSQEYGRKPMSDIQGEIAQRSLLIATVGMIPISIALQFTGVLLRQWYEVQVADAAAEWIRYSPLMVLPTLYSTTLAKFLCNQFLPHLPMIALCGAFGSLPFFQWYFIPKYGIVGSCLGLAGAAWVQLAILVVLILFNKDARTRFGSFSWDRVMQKSEFIIFLQLGLPSVVFVCAESAAFDVTALVAAQLSSVETAAWTMMLSTFLIADCVCSGISIAACALVGRALGENSPRTAVRIAITAVTVTFLWSLFDALLLYRYHRAVFGLFTQDAKVLEAASSIAWIIVPLHVSDSVQFAFQGIFSGAGQNHFGAAALVTCLWGGGVGSIFYLLRNGYGLLGVPLGLTIGLVLCCPVLAFLCFYWFDWKLLAEVISLEEEVAAEEGIPGLRGSFGAFPHGYGSFGLTNQSNHHSTFASHSVHDSTGFGGKGLTSAPGTFVSAPMSYGTIEMQQLRQE